MVVSTHVPAQTESLPGHACTHAPPVQLTLPPVGAVHATHVAPQ